MPIFCGNKIVNQNLTRILEFVCSLLVVQNQINLDLHADVQKTARNESVDFFFINTDGFDMQHFLYFYLVFIQFIFSEN